MVFRWIVWLLGQGGKWFSGCLIGLGCYLGKAHHRWSVGGSPTSWQTRHTSFNQPFGGEPPRHFRFQPCALRCGITIYTQIKDLDKWIRLPLAWVIVQRFQAA
ncbi:hypothetical protein [Kingella bonacorsii]|uniref:Secreted protein n=1 Tax=Kingella bonacorsii TaxID=2796361 RepID=A0ABS1BU54_9NEIS|nr:hypothetical protein [Kingella bonacorsii]MBK0396772.1 hypothetical protein [Kingella bonacorsii]